MESIPIPLANMGANGEVRMCMFSSSPKPPPPPPPPPERSDADVQAADMAERMRARLARGRAATVLTGGQGDLAPAPTAAKTLLGQ